MLFLYHGPLFLCVPCNSSLGLTHLKNSNLSQTSWTGFILGKIFTNNLGYRFWELFKPFLWLHPLHMWANKFPMRNLPVAFIRSLCTFAPFVYVCINAGSLAVPQTSQFSFILNGTQTSRLCQAPQALKDGQNRKPLSWAELSPWILDTYSDFSPSWGNLRLGSFLQIIFPGPEGGSTLNKCIILQSTTLVFNGCQPSALYHPAEIQTRQKSVPSATLQKFWMLAMFESSPSFHKEQPGSGSGFPQWYHYTLNWAKDSAWVLSQGTMMLECHEFTYWP